MKAARDAGVVIHALGYLAETTDPAKFQTLQRLADETGGVRREVRVGGVQKYAVGKQFVTEVLENGGILKFSLKEPPGPVSVTLTADLGNARFASIDHSFTVPGQPTAPAPSPRTDQTTQPSPTSPDQPAARNQGLFDWVMDNTLLSAIIAAGLVTGVVGLSLLLFGGRSEPAPEPAPVVDATPKVVYGWLDTLDGDSSHYPLQTTNIRIGRHRDNDICLLNDSISRRHAVLHFNANNRRFVITDLGGDNGVIVNKVKQQSHELSDGDVVELGEVRLRFRANAEQIR